MEKVSSDAPEDSRESSSEKEKEENMSGPEGKAESDVSPTGKDKPEDNTARKDKPEDSQAGKDKPEDSQAGKDKPEDNTAGKDKPEDLAADNSDTENSAAGPAKPSGKSRVLIFCLIFFPLLLLLGAGGLYFIDSLAYNVCRVEAGVKVSPGDFLKYEDEEAVFAPDSAPFDITCPGEYLVKIKSGFFTHSCRLIVQDTIPPTGDPVQVQAQMGGSCEPGEFVANIADATEVAVSFVEEPDYTISGVQPVRILLEDMGHNQTIIESQLFITQVVEQVTVEVGQEAPGLESFVVAGQEAAFVTDLGEIDFSALGEYPVEVQVDGQVYQSRLQVVDTVPPQAEVQDVEGYVLAPRSVEEFVVRVEDATEVTAAFRQEPDLTHTGVQKVEIVFTDAGNNETVLQAKLTLKEDTEPPVIQGAKDISIFVGDSVSYRKNVSVADNCPQGVELEVDSSGVNLKEAGVYPVIYTARDLAGNTSSVTVNLTVKDRTFNGEEVYAMADTVLAEILTEGMTPLEKVTAIYDYVKGHVAYVSHSEKGDWLKAAYQGLSEGKGDCYTYANTSKLLLTRAGIQNMDIAKIPAKSNHVWNLVDIGDGWYHFDTCPRRGLTEKILMWTDEQLMEYSDSHNKSHNYDHSAYPEVN